MIGFRLKGDFTKTSNHLKNLRNSIRRINFDKYGEQGVSALASATPFDTGLTSRSWHYKVERTDTAVTIMFCNSNIQNGIPIAIILQYGHATRNGGWVEGRDYINPAIQPIFDELAKKAWGEVTKL